MSLQRYSRLKGYEVSAPTELVNHFRFGTRRDPWTQLAVEDVRNAHEALSQRVRGQSEAIDAVVRGIAAAYIGIDFVDPTVGRTGPRGAFFFVGPTGVGKTELAKALASYIFKDETALVRFDMTEYQQPHSDQRLVGSPPGYIGHGSGGQLTSRVMQRPFSVLLFDEAEKAHHRIFDLFLQILDDGRLTDGEGQTADFSQSLIIFTSNQGTEDLYTGAAGDPGSLTYDAIQQYYKKHIEWYFSEKLERPELLGRLGKENILAFDVIRADTALEIATKFLRQLTGSVEARGVSLVFDEAEFSSAATDLAHRTDQLASGGRGIRRALAQLVRDPLVGWMLEHGVPSGGRMRLELDAGRLVVTAEETV